MPRFSQPTFRLAAKVYLKWTRVFAKARSKIYQSMAEPKHHYVKPSLWQFSMKLYNRVQCQYT